MNQIELENLETYAKILEEQTMSDLEMSQEEKDILFREETYV